MASLKLAVIITFLVLGILLWSIFWAAMWFLNVTGIGALVMTFSFVGVMILVQWAIGPAIIKSLTKMREADDPKLIKMVHDLADQAGIPRPKVYVVNNPTPNAFAFGRTQKSAGVAVHSGLLAALDEGEVRGVLAHEVGHIKHRDVMVMTLASALPVLLYYIVFFGTIFASARDERGGGFNFLGAWLGGMVAQFVGTLLVLYLSRVREYHADAYSAQATRKPMGLANALAKITYSNATHRQARPTGTANLRTFYICDPQMSMAEYKAGMEREKSRGFTEIFMTHPLTYKRINALQKMEKTLT